MGVGGFQGERWDYSQDGGGGGAITSGTFAARPAAGTNVGDMYIATNAPYKSVWNGASWDVFISDFGQVTVPPSAGWTWRNQAGATVDATTGVQILNGATGNLTLRMRTAPVAPWTLDVDFTFGGGGPGNEQRYVAFENGAGNLVLWGDIVAIQRIHRWTSPTVFSSSGASIGRIDDPQRWRFIYDGTDLDIYFMPYPGVTHLVATESVSAGFLGSIANFGFGTREATSTLLRHWSVA